VNLFVELSGEPHFNNCRPRVRQAEHRAAKGLYNPYGRRASHDVQGRKMQSDD